MFGGHWFSANVDIKYSLFYLILKSFVLVLFMVCHCLAKFGGHRYCGSREILLLVCHII